MTSVNRGFHRRSLSVTGTISFLFFSLREPSGFVDFFYLFYGEAKDNPPEAHERKENKTVRSFALGSPRRTFYNSGSYPNAQKEREKVVNQS